MALGGLLCLLGPTAYRWMKVRRALRIVAEARTAMSSDDWETIRPRVKAALALAPKDVEVLRLARDYSWHFQTHEALNYASFAAEAAGATLEDRRTGTHIALGLGELDKARTEIDHLLRQQPDDIDALRMQADLRLLEGNRPEAVATLERVDRMHPGEPKVECALGVALLESPIPAEEHRGHNILWGLAVRPNPEQRRALFKLCDHGCPPYPERKLLARILGGLPKPQVQDWLAGFALEIDPTDPLAPGVFGRVRAFAERLDARERIPVLDWLYRRGGYATALELAPEGMSCTNAVLLGWRLAALTALHRWDEFETLVGHTNLPLPELHLHLARAISAAARTNTRALASELKEAITLASPRPAALLAVAEHAERWGMDAEAIEAWERLLTDPAYIRRASEAILRLTAHADAPRAVARAARRALEIDPENHALLAQLCYILLLGDGLDEKLAAQLEQRAKGETPSRDVKTLWALQLLKKGRPDEALNWLDNRVQPSSADSHLARVVATAVYGANLRRALATQFGRELAVEPLTLTERDLIRQWLQ